MPLRPVHAMGIVDSAGVSEEDTSAGNGDGGVEAGEADRQEEASASAQDKVKKLAPDMKDSDGQNEEGAGDIGQVARVMYIRVPNPDGGFFFFDTATQQLYEGDGEPPADQILEEPTLDSPLRLPPREGGF